MKKIIYLVACMLTCSIVTMAQQSTYEPDSRYICPENGVMTKLSNRDFDHDNLQFYLCEANGKVGVVDEHKRVIIPIEYDEIKRISSDYYLIRNGNDCGVITQYGEFVFPPALASITYNAGNFTLTSLDGSSITVEEDFHFDSKLQRIAAWLSLYSGWGNAFLLRADSTTKTIPLDEFWSSGVFHDGLMPILDKNSKKLGYLNTKGEWAIPISISQDPSFGDDLAFSGGYLVLSQTGKYRIYDKKGQVLWALSYQSGEAKNDITDYVEGGYALVRVRTGNRAQWKYVSPTGKQLFPEVYGSKTYPIPYGTMDDFIRPMCDEMVAFADFSTSEPKWGFFDKNGKVIARGKYAKVHDFQDGLAAVKMPEGGENPNKWGFIDKTGQMIIPAMFTNEPGDFSEGLAVVQKSNGLKVYINKQGEVASPQFSNALPFVHGTAFVEIFDGYKSRYFALDHSFNMVKILLPGGIFTPETRAQIEITAKYPDRPAGDVFFFPGYNITQMINNRGEFYFMWSDNIVTINSITDGVAHVSYGPYGEMREFFCDTTGKIIFSLTRKEF